MPNTHLITASFNYITGIFPLKREIRLAFLTFVCSLNAYSLFSQNPIPPIGQWREHLNYQHTIQVVKGDNLYCATNNNLFIVDEKNELARVSKITGLTDIGVRNIGWDEMTGQLVVAYNNSNLDILKGNTIKNIGDIKRSYIQGNKSINQVYCNNGLAYLSSGLGIIIVNLTKYEVKDTWIIGNNGSHSRINGFCSNGTFFFAATEEGLKNISVNSSNLANYAFWQNLSGSNNLTSGEIKNVFIADAKVIVQKNDSLLIQNGASWGLLYYDSSWNTLQTGSSENKIWACQRDPSGRARVIFLNSNGIIEKNISHNGVISYPRFALLHKGIPWIADQFGGLSMFGQSVERFIPNGPPGPASGEMAFQNETLFVAAGSVNNSWNYQYNRNGIYSFTNDQWSFKGYYNLPILDSVLDFITVAVDPTDASLWAGSFGGGLVNFQDKSGPFIYKKSNSTLQPAIGDPGSYRISGLAFDKENNLWISNYGAPQSLQVRKKDKTWKAFTIPFTHTENAVAQIIVDNAGQLWIVSPKDNGLFCYNYGQSIDNISDDKWKFFRQGIGNGNLPSNNILSIIKDKNGFIWVGTDKGIGIINCANEVFSPQSCEATLPIIQQGQFAGYLFKDEVVQCMTIDGANRKWIGTKNGVWLISPDGDRVIYRFSEENSPLLNNDVRKIIVDSVSGEVFISTFLGICSFRSTATEGGQNMSKALVFPNPVPPGYNGTIAVKGLAENALVKITELSGKLVYQTRALGGQAIWDGRNYNGMKVASGVYLVIVRDDSGSESLATKIVIVSGN